MYNHLIRLFRCQASHPAAKPLDSLCLHNLANTLARWQQPTLFDTERH